MRNIIAISILLLLGPASAKDWRDGWDDMMREKRREDLENRRLQQMREHQLMDQMEQAEQTRRLRNIERQNQYIQDDLDEIRRR